MLEKFADIDLFKGVTKEYLAGLETDCSEIILKKDDYLFHQGDTGKGMYIIIEGGIDIMVSASEGKKENVVATLGPGHCLGEISLLDKQKRIASAHANVDSKVLHLGIKKFSDHIKANDLNALRISYNIAVNMVERLERANELLTTLQTKTESKKAKREVSLYKEKLAEEGLF